MTYLCIPKACKEQCCALNANVGAKGSDKPLSLNHLNCAWREFSPFARRLVVKQVAALRLGKLCRRLSERSIAIRRSPWLVVHDLKADGTLIDDLMQEVACAMVRAVHRQKLASARPAIYGWLNRAVPLIVREECRPVALAALAGVFLQEGGGGNDDGPEGAQGCCAAEAEPAKCLSPDEQLAQYEALEEALRLASIKLTPDQRPVFTRVLRGDDVSEIASELGLTQGAVRLRLMKAKRRLAA